jgi:NAD(P)-dependent dehydrogenase (short-subunit alcohol dehydrogenase family)
MVSNVTDWEQQVAVFKAIVAKWGRVDYVFANAGIGEKIWLDRQTPMEGDYVKPNLLVSFCHFCLIQNASFVLTED